MNVLNEYPWWWVFGAGFAMGAGIALMGLWAIGQWASSRPYCENPFREKIAP